MPVAAKEQPWMLTQRSLDALVSLVVPTTLLLLDLVHRAPYAKQFAEPERLLPAIDITSGCPIGKTTHAMRIPARCIRHSGQTAPLIHAKQCAQPWRLVYIEHGGEARPERILCPAVAHLIADARAGSPTRHHKKTSCDNASLLHRT